MQQRIVPSNRQNIAQILRDNGLKIYDEYSLLMLSSGRCEQDDYYLVPIDESKLPDKIIKRFNKKIEDIVPLSGNSLLVFFRDGTIRKCDMNKYFEKDRRFSILLNRPDYFKRAQVQTGGYGVQWDENLSVSNTILYKMGKRIPLSADDFKAFAFERVINTSEAAELLGCTRQYINELVKTNKLHPIKSSEKNTLFLKSEIMKRRWQ